MIYRGPQTLRRFHRFILRHVLSTGLKVGNRIPGRAQIKEVIAPRRAVSPDWREEILDLAVTRKTVVTQHLSSDTHQGEYLGISTTGRKMVLEKISIYRLEESHVIEEWRLCGDLWCISLTHVRSFLSQSRSISKGLVLYEC